MRRYLSTLHQRSHHHKKRFALVTAGSFTLLIFAIWALANFGTSDNDSRTRASKETSPLSAFGRTIGTGFEALRGNLGGVKAGIESLDVESGFEEMRDDTLNTYGQ